MILWQPTQRSTDGRPAYSERRASAWQYWQSILNEPAWIRWLKKIGCFGAPGTVTSARALSGSNLGSASVRTKAAMSRAWASPRYAAKGGMPGDNPSAGPPCRMMLTMNASGSPFMRRPSARFEGLVAKPPAEGPSPRPASPWQTWQWVT